MLKVLETLWTQDLKEDLVAQLVTHLVLLEVKVKMAKRVKMAKKVQEVAEVQEVMVLLAKLRELT